MFLAVIAFFRPLLEGILLQYLDHLFTLSSRTVFTAYRVRLFAYVCWFLPAMLQSAAGELDDLQFLDYVWHQDLGLAFYLTPFVAISFTRWLWSMKWFLAGLISTTIVAIVTSRSMGLLGQRALTVNDLLWLHRQLLGECSIFSVRGLFIRVCDALKCTRYYLDRALMLRARSNTSACISTFEYSPLKGNRHIRLLRLERRGFASWSACCLCCLIEYPLSEAPDYEALSYTWGDKPPLIPLQVNGKCMLVTESVEEFLISHQSLLRSRYVWIDSVCINQADEVEKAKQILLMGTIYHRARRVIVWLAPPQSSSNALDIRNAMTDRYLFRNVNNLTDHSMVSAVLDRSWGSIHAEIGYFLMRPWFTRMWVIQELSMARQVHVFYRGTCLPWAAVERLCRQYMETPTVRHGVERALWARTRDRQNAASELKLILMAIDLTGVPYNIRTLDLVRAKFRGGQGLSLCQCLDISALFHCKDPRDKIFSMVGILDKKASLHFQPDYQISTESLCYKLAEYILSSDEWFQGLMRAAFHFEGKRQITPPANRLPSWVPDIRVQNSVSRVLGGRDLLTEENQEYQKRPRIVYTSNSPTLQAECLAIGTVKRLTQSLDFRSLLETNTGVSPPESSTAVTDEGLYGVTYANDMQNFYLEGRRLVRDFLGRDTTGDDFADQVFWETCTYALMKKDVEIPSNILRPRESSARKIFESYLSNMANLAGHGHLPQGPEIPEGLNGMDRHMLAETFLFLMEYFGKYMLGECLCILSTGQPAIVSRPVEEGDIIAHIRGGLAPVVLRCLDSAEKKAELVDIAYVHGVPDVRYGEGWEVWSLI